MNPGWSVNALAFQYLVDGDRQVADALAGRVEDRVRDGGRNADDEVVPESGSEQGRNEVGQAMAANRG